VGVFLWFEHTDTPLCVRCVSSSFTPISIVCSYKNERNFEWKKDEKRGRKNTQGTPYVFGAFSRLLPQFLVSYSYEKNQEIQKI
jgi:hypothetical protein